jgi:hypothetical protein
LINAIATLSSFELAQMFQLLALRSRYRTAAVASTDAYEVADSVFQEAKNARQRAKERKEHCVEEYMRFKAHADNMVDNNNLQLAAGCVQQASGKGANRLAAHNDTAT